MTLYLSAFFEKQFSPDTFFFEDVRVIPAEETLDLSLDKMRASMIKQNDFSAGIFIGGMEGIEVEYEIFKEAHPKALILPIASTGAGAKILYDRMTRNNDAQLDERLLTDYAYKALFRELLGDFIQPFDAKDFNTDNNGDENIRDI